MVTQFLCHIVRGKPIKLVDGGEQKRAFADISDGISDGISALMQIIENRDGVASGKIFNIGNPKNIHSARELAEMMLKMAADHPEYAEEARKTQIVETSWGEFYGKGYQDVQHLVPKIDNTMEELGWKPEVTMEQALRRIFEAYRDKVVDARTLVASPLAPANHLSRMTPVRVSTRVRLVITGRQAS